MKVVLTYNDLHLFLTEEDKKQIAEMNEPSLEQGRLLVRRWDTAYGVHQISDEPGAITRAMIWYKPYVKVRESLPELFL